MTRFGTVRGAAGRVLAAALILLVAALAAIYFVDTATYDDFFGARDPERRRQVATLLHIGPAIVALLAGALQFGLIARLRSPRFRRLHRVTGAIYVVAVGLSVVGAGLILPFALGGPVGVSGFLLLTLFWPVCTAFGCLAALRRDRIEHRAWMMRSYALTLAGVSLRLQLFLMTGLAGLPFDSAYVVTAWSCWVPNLVICELLILGNSHPHNRPQALL